MSSRGEPKGTADFRWSPTDDATRPHDASPPDLDPDTGVWLFRESDAETSLQYLGEQPANQATSAPAVAPQVRSARRHVAVSPAPAQVPPQEPRYDTIPRSAIGRVAAVGAPGPQRPSTAGRSALIGALLGILVLAIAAGVLWFRSPLAGTANASSVASAVASSSPAVTVATPTTQASPTETGTTLSSSASDPSLNDAANRLGWTFLIDGLGPAKLGAQAQTALDLGLVTTSTSSCGFEPTGLLGDTRVYIRGSRIDSIDIRSAAFRSGKGVHVGMSVAQLQQTYEDTLTKVDIMAGSEKVPGYALLNKHQYVLYVTDGSLINRIAIGYREGDGGILLPPRDC